MKQISVLFKSCFSIILMIVLSSSVPISKEEPSLAKDAKAGNASAAITISNKQFLQLTPKSYFQLTGMKMNFKDRMALKIAQQEVRKDIKKNVVNENDAVNLNKSMAEGRSSFRFGGFILGLLVGLIGVGLAYIFSSDRDFRKSAWKGFATWAAIVLLLWVI